MTHSVRKPNPSLPTVTWPEYPPSKYLAVASETRELMRSRNASPRSMFLPDTRNAMLISERSAQGRLLLAPSLHRRRNPHRFTIFRDRPARNVDTNGTQPFDDGVIGEDVLCRLLVDQLPDAMAHRLRRMRLTPIRGRNCGSEEVFQLEDAAARGHVFVGGDARDRRFVHADGVCNGPQVERTQVLDTVCEEAVLLAHDLGCHLQDRLGALVERTHQPGRRLQAIGNIGPVLVAFRGSDDFRMILLVHQDFRKRVRIKLDHVSAIRPGADKYVRNDWLHRH